MACLPITGGSSLGKTPKVTVLDLRQFALEGFVPKSEKAYSPGHCAYTQCRSVKYLRESVLIRKSALDEVVLPNLWLMGMFWA